MTLRISAGRSKNVRRLGLVAAGGDGPVAKLYRLDLEELVGMVSLLPRRSFVNIAMA